MNGLQADGPTAGVLRTEPVADKWAAFGWHVRVSTATTSTPCSPLSTPSPAGADARRGHPCDTRIGRGVPFLETREKAHFIRIDEHEWDLPDQLRAANPAGSTP